jgi:hypothetical protein
VPSGMTGGVEYEAMSYCVRFSTCLLACVCVCVCVCATKAHVTDGFFYIWESLDVSDEAAESDHQDGRERGGVEADFPGDLRERI